MNATLHALKVGARRGWHENNLSLRSSQDQTFYVLMALGTLTFFYFNRNNHIEEVGLTLPQAAFPTLLASLGAFALIIGPAQLIAMEREDGTVLRITSAPQGTVTYAVGQVVYGIVGLVPMLAVLVVPSVLLFDVGSQRGWTGWAVGLAVFVLGSLACLPIGLIIGRLVPDVRRATTWGFLPFGAMIAISGVFTPVSQLWGWLQPIAQALPLYWFGHGMRFAFLPDGASAGELHGDWQIPLAIAVLATWAVVAWIVAIVLMRHVGRGQSGAGVVSAREKSSQVLR